MLHALESMKEHVTKHPPVSRHDGVSQALHWATAVLVVYAFTNGLGGSEVRVYAHSRDFQRQLHETLGLSVLVLVIVRLLWRRVETRPAPRETARWMEIAAIVVQWILYVLLFAVPCSAISGAWLEGHPLTLLAGLAIPPSPVVLHDAGAAIANFHKWLGDAILWFGALHALAALYHHFVLKDSALVSMLPRWLPLGNRSRE
jgi:cytochrome b561